MEIATLTIRDLFTMIREIKVARGLAYLVAKGHRISGVLLGLYIIAHIYTLSGLANPDKFQQEMNLLSHPFFMFLEWCLVIPLAFHAFNGGRLILFELFHQHEDSRLLSWSLWLSGGFAIFMGVLMFLGTESVSTGVFWTFALILVFIVVYLVWQSVWPTFNNRMWKIQRLTGAALFSLALGHYFFMHLNEKIGHHAETILVRMSNPFVLLVDFLLLSLVMLHGWYGIQTLIKDNITTRFIRNVLVGLLTLTALVLYFAGTQILSLTISL